MFKHHLAAIVLWSLAGVVASSGAHAQQPEKPQPTVPKWIWHGEPTSDQAVVFRRTFDVAQLRRTEKATLTGSCDNQMTVTINGKQVLSHGKWWELASADITKHLRGGKNLLEVRARNEGGPAGLALRLTLGRRRVVITDETWQAATPDNAKADRWAKASVLGVVGDESLPWNSIQPTHYGAPPAPAKPATPQAPRAATGMHLPEGFRAELVYRVPKRSQGSWVALTKDPKGRLYASDQGGKGIYRITPAKLGAAGALTKVERVAVAVSAAQGLCWAFDSLYANCSGKGVFRIRDTDGDDQLDRAEPIIPLRGGGEHGPHAVIETEDGKGLYFVGGNHTDPPKFDNSRAPRNWGEDHLLPRQWDARGHARGKLAPGGWIARCDPDGSNIEIVSNGYRNPYDIALAPNGEMFTYDADMEWDIGTPWYRPTRVCHVVSGSEFGWRSGTGKWPTWYEDSLPPVVEIGPGSPTGIVFGTGARFPIKYQKALFLLDWTFGTIYAVHLEPRGASYTAKVEHFLWKKPLPVTDAIVGSDGALYFTVGGRSAQSELYRVVYDGSASTALPSAPEDAATVWSRRLRELLEEHHGKVDSSAVAEAWKQLSSEDRFIRFAARIAIENQPVAEWRQRALAEKNPQAAILALIALARQGGPDDLEGVLTALGRLELDKLGPQQKLALLRAYALAFVRLGRPDDRTGEKIATKLDASFPSGTPALDTELVRVLTYLQSPTVVEKTLALIRKGGKPARPAWSELITRNDSYGGPIARMLADMPPVQDIGYAFMLRNATKGWTLARRREYFTFFSKAARHPGGNSYAGFLTNIRRDAEAKLSVAERHALAPLLGQSLLAAPPANIKPPKGPGRGWTLAAAKQVVGRRPRGRSFARGKNLFHAAACSACHRFDGQGGAIGPDLTTVGNKFTVTDLLQAIVEPSAVISDQYGSKVVTTKKGAIAVGLVVATDANVRVFETDPTKPPRVIPRADIESIETSKISQMPPGLINPLNAEELRDLIAYLLSGGNKRDAVFRKK